MWESMSIDEYADFQQAVGADVVKTAGVWWRKTRPFYYQPLFPLLEAAPDTIRPPFQATIGGYKHMVPSGHMANSRMNYFIWDDVHEYSIETLNRKKRWSIRDGMKSVAIKPVDDFEEFITSGYQAYLSFQSRTQYHYKTERIYKGQFKKWAEILFRYPAVKILGAYYKGTLCAIDISYLIKNVLIEATFFSNTEHLKYKVSDVMVHALRESAAACPGVQCIYKGPVTGQRGLDEFKLMRGCKIVSKPAYYNINPISRYLVEKLMPNEYKKLTGKMDFVADRKEDTPLADG